MVHLAHNQAPRILKVLGRYKSTCKGRTFLTSSSARVLKISNTSAVPVTLYWQHSCCVAELVIPLKHGEAQKDQKAGRMYVSLVNTTHTEASAIPPRRFVLLPNSGWENQVTGGWELVLFIRDSNLNSQGNYSLQRHFSQSHLAQSSHVGHI